VAAQQLDRAVAGNDCNQSRTILLWFMQPIASRRLGAGRHDLRADIAGQTRRHRRVGRFDIGIGVEGK
jgi:hypothetical protein